MGIKNFSIRHKCKKCNKVQSWTPSSWDFNMEIEKQYPFYHRDLSIGFSCKYCKKSYDIELVNE